MNRLEHAAVDALPWLCAAGAVAMTGASVVKWRELSAVDRVAFGLDAVAYAAAVRPLAHRHANGWWTLWLATAIQPAFGGIEVARDRDTWPSAVGRTVGAVAGIAALSRLRDGYRP